jgi:hypothetical protein
MRVFHFLAFALLASSITACIKTTEGIRGDLGLQGTLFEGMVVAADDDQDFGEWDVDGTFVKCQQSGAAAKLVRMKCSIADASGAALTTSIPTFVVVTYGNPAAKNTVVAKTLRSTQSVASEFEIEVDTTVAQTFVGVSPSELSAQP